MTHRNVRLDGPSEGVPGRAEQGRRRYEKGLGLLGPPPFHFLLIGLLLFCINGWLAGSVLGFLNLGLPWSSTIVTLSLVVLGSLVALRAELPGKLIAGVCLFFGLAVGYANGTQMLENLKMPIFCLGGLMVCVGLMLLYCSQLVRRFRASWSQVGVRVIGSWIAAAGVLMLAFQFR